MDHIQETSGQLSAPILVPLPCAPRSPPPGPLPPPPRGPSHSSLMSLSSSIQPDKAQNADLSIVAAPLSPAERTPRTQIRPLTMATVETQQTLELMMTSVSRHDRIPQSTGAKAETDAPIATNLATRQAEARLRTTSITGIPAVIRQEVRPHMPGPPQSPPPFRVLHATGVSSYATPCSSALRGPPPGPPPLQLLQPQDSYAVPQRPTRGPPTTATAGTTARIMPADNAGSTREVPSMFPSDSQTLTKSMKPSTLEIVSYSNQRARQSSTDASGHERMLPATGLKDDQKYFWVPDADLSWVACRLVQELGDGIAILLTPTGIEVSVPNVGTLHSVEVADVAQKVVTDLFELKSLVPGSVLYQLSARYAADQVFTQAGEVLIVIEPNPSLDELLYGEESKRRAFAEIKTFDELQREPHPYSIAAAAWDAATSRHKAQSIVIAGENGSGKNEVFSRINEWLAFAASEILGHNTTLTALSSAVSVLDIFGCAWTPRYKKVPRYGKWVSIAMSNGSMPDSPSFCCTCSVDYLLLEASRVAGITKKAAENQNDQSNFEALYALLCHPDAETAYCLGKDHTFLPKHVARGFEANFEAFKNIERLLSTLGYSKGEVEDIFFVVAGIIHVGDIVFEPHDHGCRVSESSSESLELFVRFVGLSDILSVERALCSDGNSQVDQAVALRDALACALYKAIFADGLVARFNRMLSTERNSGQQVATIVVAHLPGFECETACSVETMCANFADEMLQHSFLCGAVDGERNFFAQEGVKLLDIDVRAADATLVRLFKNTIIPALAGGGEAKEDDGVVQKIADSDHFRGCVLEDQPAAFTIIHYAALTRYDATGWKAYNSIANLRAIESVLSSSTTSLVRTFFTSRSNRMSTVERARTDLERLETALHNTHHRNIRCIRPTMNERHLFPNGSGTSAFDNDVVYEQLVSSGLLDVMRIKRAGFEVRFHFADFLRRYSICATDPAVRWLADAGRANLGRAERAVDALLENIVAHHRSLSRDEIKVAKTRVFLRQSCRRYLDHARHCARAKFATALQTWCLARLEHIRLHGSRHARGQTCGEDAASPKELKQQSRQLAEREACVAATNIIRMHAEDALGCAVRDDAMIASVAAASAEKYLSLREMSAITIECHLRALVARCRFRRFSLLCDLERVAKSAVSPVEIESVKQRLEFETRTHGAAPKNVTLISVYKDPAIRFALASVEKRLRSCLLARRLREELAERRLTHRLDNPLGAPSTVPIEEAECQLLSCLEQVASCINDGSLPVNLVPLEEVNVIAAIADLIGLQRIAKLKLKAVLSVELSRPSIEKTTVRGPAETVRCTSLLERADAIANALDSALALENFQVADRECAELVKIARCKLNRLDPLHRARYALRRAIELASPSALRAAIERRAPIALIEGDAFCHREFHAALELLRRSSPTVHVHRGQLHELCPDFLSGCSESVPDDALLQPHVFTAMKFLYAASRAPYGASPNGARSSERLRSISSPNDLQSRTRAPHAATRYCKLVDSYLLKSLLPHRRAREEALRMFNYVQAHAYWLHEQKDTVRAATPRVSARSIVLSAVERAKNVNDGEIEDERPLRRRFKEAQRQIECNVPEMTTNEMHIVATCRKKWEYSLRSSNRNRLRRAMRSKRLDDALSAMITNYRMTAQRHVQSISWH